MKRNNLKQSDRVSQRWSITHFNAPDVCSYVTKSSYSAVLDSRRFHLINYTVCVDFLGCSPVSPQPRVHEGDNRGLCWVWTGIWLLPGLSAFKACLILRFQDFLCCIVVISCFLPPPEFLLFFSDYFLLCRCLVVSPWSLLMIKMWFRWLSTFPV